MNESLYQCACVSETIEGFHNLLRKRFGIWTHPELEKVDAYGFRFYWFKPDGGHRGNELLGVVLDEFNDLHP